MQIPNGSHVFDGNCDRCKEYRHDLACLHYDEDRYHPAETIYICRSCVVAVAAAATPVQGDVPMV